MSKYSRILLTLFFGFALHLYHFLSVLLLRDVISLLSWITAGFPSALSSPEASHPTAHCPGRLLAWVGRDAQNNPTRRFGINKGSLTALIRLIYSEIISPLGQNSHLRVQPQTRAWFWIPQHSGELLVQGTDHPMSTSQWHTTSCQGLCLFSVGRVISLGIKRLIPCWLFK